MFQKVYSGKNADYVAFPLGGMGAGMLAFDANATLSHVSIHNNPSLKHVPLTFAALYTQGAGARLLEGPVPDHRILYYHHDGGQGLYRKTYGFPRYKNASFTSRFPFCESILEDKTQPIRSIVTSWSPFIPNDPDNSGLPVAFLEYKLINISDKTQQLVFSYSTENEVLLRLTDGEVRSTRRIEHGFVHSKRASGDNGWNKRDFSVICLSDQPNVDCRWLRSGWFDAVAALWRGLDEGKSSDNPPYPDDETPSDGAGLSFPLELKAGEERTITLALTWYSPDSRLRVGDIDKSRDTDSTRPEFYKPWYSTRFCSIDEVNEYIIENYKSLRDQSKTFSDCLYDTTLSPQAVDALTANLSILKSPTVLRQHDGRLWGWEGTSENNGSCHGSCTHVWNYAQALSHLFPSMERTLRETEFFESQTDEGHQSFRANLPISPAPKTFHAASDGQLGGIMKCHREWRISGDMEWLRMMWPKIKLSLDYCIRIWDPDEKGALFEPHHNTYDIEFWGPDGMCSSFYLGALKAAALMGKALSEDISRYEKLYTAGREYIERELYNGEYFFQKVMREGLYADADSALKGLPPEAAVIVRQEGPKYQYGTGCLIDGVLGDWIARMCGVGEVLDPEKVKSHLLSVYKYNFKRDLTAHSNSQRTGYFMNDEQVVVNCTWPHGGKPVMSFPYSDEGWTGPEYQFASHLALFGLTNLADEIIAASRARYDGKRRNPFDEYECGHWYARAMSSYGFIQGFTGLSYDAVDKILTLNGGRDFRAFLSTATGYGTAGIKDGIAFIENVHGEIEIKDIQII